VNAGGPHAGSATDPVFQGREFPFTRHDFRRIAGMLRADAGIVLSETKAPLVYARLVRRLRALGLESFARYCALVETETGGDERQTMMSALTTNVTAFFREPHHFAHLKTRVLPRAIEAARRGGRLRIWSAGCATGEEAYSIALSILEVMPDASRFDVRVLATDINAAVLAVAEAGEYDEAALAPVARRLRADWFTATRAGPGRGRFRVGDELRRLVAFRPLNLLSSWPMTAAYHAVFCRNVLIYFDEADQAGVQQRIKSLLAPGGRLYLGAAERVRVPDGLAADGVTVHRLQDDDTRADLVETC